MDGVGPPLSDDLDLGKAKAELRTSGLRVPRATAVVDNVSGKGKAMQNDGLGMGVKDTGSSLATLARALADDGVRTDFHDAREDEKIPLKSRVKGARVSHALHRSAVKHGSRPCNHGTLSRN